MLKKKVRVRAQKGDVFEIFLDTFESIGHRDQGQIVSCFERKSVFVRTGTNLKMNGAKSHFQRFLLVFWFCIFGS